MSKKILLAKELHKPVRKHFEKRSILIKGIHDLWAADLIDMKKFSKENKGYMYILNVIDTFSKFAWAIPVTSKDGVTVSKAFEKIKAQRHRNINHPICSILIKAPNLKTNISRVFWTLLRFTCIIRRIWNSRP